MKIFWLCKTAYPTGQIIIYRNGVPLFAVTRDMRDGEPEFTDDQRYSEAIQLCAAANQAPALDDAQRAVLVEIARYIQSSNDANRPSAGVRSSAVKILNGLIDAPAPLSVATGEIAAAPPVRYKLNLAIQEFYQRENVPLHVCSAELVDAIATAALKREGELHSTIYLMPGSHLSMARAINLANKLLPIIGSTMGVITNETFTSYDNREFEPGTVVPPSEKYKYDPSANRNVEPIPTDVYWSNSESNFYGAVSHMGQGDEFLAKWFPRRDEFPTRMRPAAISFTQAGKDMGAIGSLVLTGSEPRPTCLTCRHACRTDEGKAVSCHRYPPNYSGASAWPEVNDNVWCGEHQPL